MTANAFPTDATLVKDAAARIGISPKTVRRWVRIGKLPGWRLPAAKDRGKLVVSLADVLALLTSVQGPQPGSRAALTREEAETLKRWGIREGEST